MKLLIVDDEPLARERLARMVAEFPGWEVNGALADGAEVLAFVEAHEPDVVLLDIHMPGVDGLQVARQLAELAVPPAVIFTTAHSQHALSAHQAGAAGYLLKPVRSEQLAAALTRARRPSRAQLRADDSGPPASGARRYLHASTHEGTARVAVDDVIYFLADQKYVTVYHLHGQLLIEDSLKTLADELDAGFMRVHRKALVAVRHIQALVRDGDGMALRLRHTDNLVPVSRRRLADVRALLHADS